MKLGVSLLAWTAFAGLSSCVGLSGGLGEPSIPGPGDKEIFTQYRRNSVSTWSPSWTRRLDFSGVAWDNPRAGCLIHPRFVVYSSHFQRSVGELLVFHDRDGYPVSRKILAKKTINRIGEPDITVGMLDRPVPSGVRHYPMGPEGRELGLGTKLLVTDRDRRVHIFEISQIQEGRYEELIARPGFPKRIRPEWSKRLVRGDSGHPAFVLSEGRLALAATLRGGGWAFRGPYYGGSRVRDAVEEAMRELSAQG